MPALRSRLEDLPLLIRDFAAHNVAEGRSEVQLAPRALAALALCQWPGNVRELANLVERLSIVTAGRTADIADLPAKYRPSAWSSSWGAPELASDSAALDTSGAGRIWLDSYVLPRGTQLLPTTQAILEYDTDEDAAEKTARAADGLAVLREEGLDLRAHLNEIERKLVVQALE